MSKKNTMAIFSMFTLLLAVACGGNDSSSSSPKKRIESNTVCDKLACLSSVDWNLKLLGQSFPERTKLVINDETVLDECWDKQQYSVSRDTAPMSIRLDSYKVPTGPINIKIIDRNWDCQGTAVFLEKKDASYTLEKTNFGGQQLVIEL